MQAMEQLTWTGVEKRYAWVDLGQHVAWAVAAVVLGFVGAWFAAEQQMVALALKWGGVALGALQLVLALFSFRRVRSIGYVLREDDLLFRYGIMFRRMVAVPYGRLQLVDIHRGPLMRALGLSSLRFVTAAAATGVKLHGLSEADAEQLRDSLVALAESRRSGL